MLLDSGWWATDTNSIMKHWVDVFFTPFGFVDMTYKTKDREYKLTGDYLIYNDMITYKQAEMTFNPLFGCDTGESVITEYVFGYKQKLDFDNTTFHFKALLKIAEDVPIHLEVRLVANQDLHGKLQFLRHGVILDEYDAPLSAEISGEMKWVVS